MTGLTPDELEWRRNFIGGSDAPMIMSGDWFTGWMEKTGRQEHEDTTWVLPAQMGVVTEPLNRLWYEHTTGNKLYRVREHVISHNHPFLACTLDGYVYSPPASSQPEILYQAKCVNAFMKLEEIHDKYLPQVTHEMICTGAELAHLSVFIGTLKYEVIPIEFDPFYAARYIAEATKFWKHVTTDTAPTNNAAAGYVPKMPALRKVSMQGNNAWAQSSADWRENKIPAKRFKDADAAIKALVEDDVCEATGHGIIVKRAKNGNLTIKAE